MTEYTIDDLIQDLKELSAVPNDERWEERLRLAMMIEYLSGLEEERGKENKDE